MSGRSRSRGRSTSRGRSRSRGTKKVVPKTKFFDAPVLSLTDFLTGEDILTLTKVSKAERGYVTEPPAMQNKMRESKCEVWTKLGQRCISDHNRIMMIDHQCYFYCQNHYFNALRNLFFLLTSPVTIFYDNGERLLIYPKRLKIESFRTYNIEFVINFAMKENPNMNGIEYENVEDMWDVVAQSAVNGGWITDNMRFDCIFSKIRKKLTPSKFIAHLPDGRNVELEPDRVGFVDKFLRLQYDIKPLQYQ
jgi:hypothetical protein